MAKRFKEDDIGETTFVSSSTGREDTKKNDISSEFARRLKAYGIKGPEDIGGGYESTTIRIITKKNYTQAERAQCALLTTKWVPKGSTNRGVVAGHPQRCPSVWVDNFVFIFDGGMREPRLILGRQKKKMNMYGKDQMIDGLVVAAGGHVETMGEKSEGLEPGDICLREAADKEMKEEIGIDRRNVVATLPVAVISDPLNDPTRDGLRFVYLRFVKQQVRTSDELKDVFTVPVSKLKDLCDGSISIKSADDVSLSFIRNHDQFVKKVMSLSETESFLAVIHSFDE